MKWEFRWLNVVMKDDQAIFAFATSTRWCRWWWCYWCCELSSPEFNQSVRRTSFSRCWSQRANRKSQCSAEDHFQWRMKFMLNIWLLFRDENEMDFLALFDRRVLHTRTDLLDEISHEFILSSTLHIFFKAMYPAAISSGACDRVIAE